MKSVCICSSNIRDLETNANAIQKIEIEGIPIYVGLVETTGVVFDESLSSNDFNVLIRKKAFSLNYRDKSLLLSTAILAEEKMKADKVLYSGIGSEFVAEVVQIGRKVATLKIGDRVIPNANFPHSGYNDVLPGLPTNYASREYDVFHERKLIIIPSIMPDAIAAGFTIGAQTIYSIIRKLNLPSNSNVLVTSVKSNTSLFAINALKKCNVNLYAISSSKKFEDKILNMGVKELIQVDHNASSFRQNTELKQLRERIKGFDAIIDPFSDLHLTKIIDFLNFDAKYITCGIYDQYSKLLNNKVTAKSIDFIQIMKKSVLINATIVGNCLGTTEDLENAITDYANGNLDVIIDSVYSKNEIGDFFVKTFNDSSRFGKVIYQY